MALCFAHRALRRFRLEALVGWARKDFWRRPVIVVVVVVDTVATRLDVAVNAEVRAVSIVALRQNSSWNGCGEGDGYIAKTYALHKKGGEGSLSCVGGTGYHS